MGRRAAAARRPACRQEAELCRWTCHPATSAPRQMLLVVWAVLVAAVTSPPCSAYHTIQEENVGTLSGDVQNWATLIQNYILQVDHTLLLRQVVFAVCRDCFQGVAPKHYYICVSSHLKSMLYTITRDKNFPADF